MQLNTEEIGKILDCGLPTTRNERRQLAKVQAERIRFLEVENSELRRIVKKLQDAKQVTLV